MKEELPVWTGEGGLDRGGRVKKALQILSPTYTVKAGKSQVGAATWEERSCSVVNNWASRLATCGRDY